MKITHITIATSALGFLIAGAYGATAEWMPSAPSPSRHTPAAINAHQINTIRIVGAPYLRDDGIILLGAAEARAQRK